MPEQDFGANALGTDPNPNPADGIVAANPQRYLTYGEKAVGLTFNPSGDPLVYDAKLAIANLINTLDNLRGYHDDPEKKRLCSVAITELQGAQMWVVKAITWDLPKSA